MRFITRLSLMAALLVLMRGCGGGDYVFAQANAPRSGNVHWPASCGPGEPYAPNGDLCINIGGTLNPIGGVFQIDQFAGSSFDVKLGECIAGLSTSNGGTCDGRKFSGALTLAGNITVTVPNVHIYLPCASITTAYEFVVEPGIQNVHLDGCSSMGGSTSAGATTWHYTGAGVAFAIGAGTTTNTTGFMMNDVNVDLSAAGSAATALWAFRAQDIALVRDYFTGNQGTGQGGVIMNGASNYSGGLFESVKIDGFGTAVLGQSGDGGTDDGVNGMTFVRMHIDCPTSGGSPIAGTYGFSMMVADGDTWTGGDVEGCATMFHLGPNAQNNTIIGLRNENSTIQYQADSGASYNSVVTGGTFYTGEIVDNGSRNSFSDAFHRTVNGMQGDWYASQQDATVTNHYRLGTGTGNVRGIEWESFVDQGTSSNVANWLWGITDGTSGLSNWIFQDTINNVIRLQLSESTTPGAANISALNASGGGYVCFNCSNGSGTAGVVFSSGGATPSTVASLDSFGNLFLNGNLQVGGVSTFIGSATVKNQADAEIDMTLYAGLTTSQKESFIYKDWNGASQWYMEKDASNNWELNSAASGIDAFKVYQASNSGDIYIDTTNISGTIRLNYENSSGNATNIYGGNSSTLIASFTAPSGTPAIKFPTLASLAAHSLLQIDNSGFLSNTGLSLTQGSVASASGTTVSHNFSVGYSSIPACYVAPLSSSGAWYFSAIGDNSFTITYANTGAQTFDVLCYGPGGVF